MELNSHMQGSDLVFTLKGRFTFADNPAFRDVLDRISRPEARQIVFQLTDVEFIDSAALGMLLLAQEEAKRREKAVCIAGAQGHVRRIMDMARFEQFFVFL